MMNNETNNNKPKALFVGKVSEGNREKFENLMGRLEEGFKNDTSEGKGEVAPCINYDYYESLEGNLQEYIPDEYKPFLEESKPKTWVDEGMKRDCMDIINDALQLIKYDEYLVNNRNKLIKDESTGKEYNICCSVNYYDKRNSNEQTGGAAFHQDSLGIELFVLLIYRNTVYGPELRLKDEEKFTERMNDIAKIGFMPGCFIDTAKDLYKGVKNQEKGLIESNRGPVELHEGIVEWIDVVEGPGGIVGFVDELMTHSTPYINHREPNSSLLLAILELMKNDESFSDKLVAIEFLQRIIKEKNDHYITVDELQSIINIQQEGKEAMEKILSVLYVELGNLEVKIKEYNYLFNLYKRYKELNALSLLPSSKLEKLKNLISELQELQKKLGELKGVDLVLGVSEHDFYGVDELLSHNIESKQHHHTGSRQRRLSMKLNEGLPEIPKSDKRSFLRVWVVALPKKNI